MKIALLGDIAFYGKYCLLNNNNIKGYFSKVASLLKNYDYVIGNLETPFVEGNQPYGAKSAYIKSDPINVELLKLLNIGIVNLANNHIYDYGKDGFQFTKRVLEQNNIDYFGVDGKETLLDFDGCKAALHGYCCYSTNPMGMYEKDCDHGVNPLSVPIVEEKLEEFNKQGYYNIVSVHCGEEHVNYPNYNHVKMARQFAKICSYTFYGHHPHVMQGIEEVNSSVIAYSLGNFCFDDVYTNKSKDPLIKQSENNKTSIIIELEIENGNLVSYKPIPIYAGEHFLNIEGEEVLDKLTAYSNKLKEDKLIYEESRKVLINNYISSRKSLRNFNWYVKRLNFKSFLMIKASKQNAKKFKSNVVENLK